MFGALLRIGGAQILEKLKDGPAKISDVKKSVPLYGAAFDFVLSELMVFGLIRRFEKDGEEYIELTELGKNLISSYTFWVPRFRRHGHHWHAWIDW